MIFKLVSGTEWRDATEQGAYLGSADDLRDGYIHLSAPAQVAETARKYFSGVQDLVIVAFDEADLGAALKWEPSRGGQLFPHYYGSLPAKLARWQRQVALGATGEPIIPEDVTAC